MFSQRLREARKNSKLTQEGLAELIGVSKFTIKRWERGQGSLPNNQIMGLISDALSCPLCYLYGVLNEKETALVEIYRHLAPYDKNELLKLAETMKEIGDVFPSKRFVG